MPRKWIIAAIGGGEAAGPEVQAFGELVVQVGAILMTGGIPALNSSRVTERAQAGCEAAGGLMISVLPNTGRNAIVACHGQRRFEVLTNVSKFGRDPITGAAADMVFVFPGEVGTLVELAYASREKRPILFCGTRAQRNEMGALRRTKEAELREGLKTAVLEYGPDYKCEALNPDYVTQTVDKLEHDLDEGLQRIPLGDITDLLQRIPPGAPDPAATNFLGLPDCTGVEEFRSLAAQMSAFGPVEHFIVAN
ncbi:SLOG cluster 4 domain-containing protein [Rhizobium leguminosarum]